MITLLFLVRATCVLFLAHIPFVLNCTCNVPLTERLQQYSFTLGLFSIYWSPAYDALSVRDYPLSSPGDVPVSYGRLHKAS